MRSRALMLSEPQLLVLAKRLDGRILTAEEQRLLKTIRFRLTQMVEALTMETTTR